MEAESLNEEQTKRIKKLKKEAVRNMEQANENKQQYKQIMKNLKKNYIERETFDCALNDVRDLEEKVS